VASGAIMPLEPSPDHWKTFVADILPNVAFIGLQLVVQLVWARRMSADRRRRIWPWPHRGLLLMNPTSLATMVAFAWITRRNRTALEAVRAIALGIFWLVVVLSATVAVDAAYLEAAGLADEPGEAGERGSLREAPRTHATAREAHAPANAAPRR
jgi:hypothetical protein